MRGEGPVALQLGLAQDILAAEANHEMKIYIRNKWGLRIFIWI